MSSSEFLLVLEKADTAAEPVTLQETVRHVLRRRNLSKSAP
jgi:hypothetical protein